MNRKIIKCLGLLTAIGLCSCDFNFDLSSLNSSSIADKVSFFCCQNLEILDLNQNELDNNRVTSDEALGIIDSFLPLYGLERNKAGSGFIDNIKSSSRVASIFENNTVIRTVTETSYTKDIYQNNELANSNRTFGYLNVDYAIDKSNESVIFKTIRKESGTSNKDSINYEIYFLKKENNNLYTNYNSYSSGAFYQNKDNESTVQSNYISQVISEASMTGINKCADVWNTNNQYASLTTVDTFKFSSNENQSLKGKLRICAEQIPSSNIEQFYYDTDFVITKGILTNLYSHSIEVRKTVINSTYYYLETREESFSFSTTNEIVETPQDFKPEDIVQYL